MIINEAVFKILTFHFMLSGQKAENPMRTCFQENFELTACQKDEGKFWSTLNF